MAVAYPTKYKEQLEKGEKGVNAPVKVIEIALDGGTVKFGESNMFTDWTGGLGPITFQANRIDNEKGFSTLGQWTFQLKGSQRFLSLIVDNFLKNRRVFLKEGFRVDGYTYADFAQLQKGIVKSWTRRGEILMVKVSADDYPLNKNIPEEKEDKTHYIAFDNINPADAMSAIITTHEGVPAADFDSVKVNSERDQWIPGFIFHRYIVDPKKGIDYLNQLQLEANFFIFHDGEKITGKYYGPLAPGETALTLRDKTEINLKSIDHDSGFDDNFYNRIYVYFDHDGSSSDNEENFETAVLVEDLQSQSDNEEVRTKVIKCFWIRSFKWSQPATMTEIVVYHLSASNGVSSGTGYDLKWNAINSTLTWTAPDGIEGAAVKIETNGRFNLFDADTRKYIRVIVTDFTTLSARGNTTDSITIDPLSGLVYAKSMANRWLNRYANPVSTMIFTIDMNKNIFQGKPLTPAIPLALTTQYAAAYNKSSFNEEQMLTLSVARKGAKVIINCTQNQFSNRYMYIAPGGQPDYAGATDKEREHWYIGRASDNKVFDGVDYVPGFVMI